MASDILTGRVTSVGSPRPYGNNVGKAKPEKVNFFALLTSVVVSQDFSTSLLSSDRLRLSRETVGGMNNFFVNRKLLNGLRKATACFVCCFLSAKLCSDKSQMPALKS